MATETPSVAPPRAEVPMVDAEVVRQIRELHRGGWGAKRIARELEVARNTVRRYLRLRTVEAGIQIRPRARQLDAPARAEALRLFDGPAEHNAVVVTQLLRERGVAATERVVQKVVAPRRRELRALQLATVRYETAPGHQMQVDFGQKRVRIGERTVVVHLLVAVLSYSRRIFVKAFLAERGDDWREGIAEAFRHFGGVPRTVLGDNARALVVRHDRGAQTVVFHPAYLAFCRDWEGSDLDSDGGHYCDRPTTPSLYGHPLHQRLPSSGIVVRPCAKAARSSLSRPDTPRRSRRHASHLHPALCWTEAQSASPCIRSHSLRILLLGGLRYWWPQRDLAVRRVPLPAIWGTGHIRLTIHRRPYSRHSRRTGLGRVLCPEGDSIAFGTSKCTES